MEKQKNIDENLNSENNSKAKKVKKKKKHVVLKIFC